MKVAIASKRRECSGSLKSRGQGNAQPSEGRRQLEKLNAPSGCLCIPCAGQLVYGTVNTQRIGSWETP
eukprot:1668280-Prorocentrum_lima.AAC.1